MTETPEQAGALDDKFNADAKELGLKMIRATPEGERWDLMLAAALVAIDVIAQNAGGGAEFQAHIVKSVRKVADVIEADMSNAKMAAPRAIQ